LLPAVRREFRGLDSVTRERILRALIELETHPRPPGAKKLAGREDLWRIRVGDYRIVYEIHDRILLVLVVRVAHRHEAYR
jgi:mRNA interferase RelE/StbE